MRPAGGEPVPAPPADSAGGGDEGVVAMPGQMNGPYPVPNTYAPYFERSYGATQALPSQSFRRQKPFGPQLMYEANIDNGLGFEDGFHRFNARIPHHLIENTTVLMGDVSASVTNSGRGVFSAGGVYRNYDATRDRIFGWNGFLDYDEGYGSGEFYRATAGVELLGEHIDWMMNGYFVLGDESNLLTDDLISEAALSGNTIYKVRRQTRENAWSGFDIQTGGPLPILGQYGVNGYVGGYYLDTQWADETVGFSLRAETLITESITANVYYTNDDAFGDNAWVSVAFTIPNYKGENRVLRSRRSVRDRLQDPVIRSNRIHSSVDTNIAPQALVRAETGAAWNVLHVDPNATTPGIGTFESPFMTMQQAVAANAAGVDIIRVSPRADDTGTNLTANGGLTLFDNQILLSALKQYDIDENCFIAADMSDSGLGPLIQDPGMLAGGAVVRLANNTSVIGMRIDGSNADGTVFGDGVANPLPIADVNISCNIFTNYRNGANLQDVSGRVIVEDNEFDGLLGASNDGLLLTGAAGSTIELLARNNTAADNSGYGMRIIAEPGATINADDPNGITGDPTGISGNDVSDNAAGMLVEARAGATVNAVIEDNLGERNTYNGLVLRADAGTFNLDSLRNNVFNNNLENGVFIHYLNGGTFNAVSEDVNGNGILEVGEDLNGNGLLDQGIVTNTANENGIAGICIFGEDASSGVFDVGGPVASLGNTLNGNAGGGLLVDLQDTATGQVDALFNTMLGGAADPGLTIVLDFIDPGQASEIDINGRQVNEFDIAPYGFSPGQYDVVTNAILETVRSHYRNLPTSADNPLSSLPPGEELAIDIVIGDTGVAPSNGATEYYVLTIGDSAVNLGGLAGQAGDIGNIRNAQGQGPGLGLAGTPQPNGASAVGVYTNSINQFSPFLSPPNAFSGSGAGTGGTDGGLTIESPDKTPQYAIDALTSGNLTFTRRAIGLVTSHELGHALSLRHIELGSAVTQNNQNAIMATPAIDAPLQVLVEQAEFALQGTNPGELPGEAPFTQFSVSQLVSAVGTRPAVSASGAGAVVTASDSAVLEASTFNNNTIQGAQRDGIAVIANDNATVEGVTIQGNDISGGPGNGIRLEANGPGATIDADDTIGGDGFNTYAGTQFAQGNTVIGNEGDGFRAHARNGGTIYGNLINNTFIGQGGDGAALLIENGGTIDFGNAAENRIISGNTISGDPNDPSDPLPNGGAGIRLVSNVSATSVAQMDALIQGNEISGKAEGGIFAQLNGPNNTPPFPPAVQDNNILNLTAGGTTGTQSNSVQGNGSVGVGVQVTGNGLANVDIRNNVITGTSDEGDPVLNGDGINLRRADSSLLLATVEDNTSTGNEGDGLDVDVQGNDSNDPNQPLPGTVNSVDWNRNLLSNNGQNGARFRTRGDSVLIADGQGNRTNNNGQNGILINTSENSSFGDPTDGLPPGRRVVIDGHTSENNSVDGAQIVATEDSRALVEITSTRVPGTTGAHAALNTNGDSSFSNNSRDGIRIETTGGRSDILITSGTGDTVIDSNGQGAGGNGIRWDSSGDADAIVRVTRTQIRNNIAGVSEDTNNNGVLDPGEDLNNNDDIDVADGDGIQANFSETTTSTLIVGNIGEGNLIQSNQDDGLAITATGSDATGNARPIITVLDNVIGGELNGIPAGNGGDGISINVFGGTDVGIDPGSVDFTLPLLSPNNGVTESGAIPQVTIDGNLISQNNRRGANVRLTGAAGTRDRENGNATFDPVRITFNDNTIVSNGEEGVFVRADSDMNQSRFTYLANFPDPPHVGFDRLQIFPFYDPLQPQFQAFNAGSVNGNTAFLGNHNGNSAYLNLRTVQNTMLTVTNNTIQNNGTNTVTGEGLFINVGTGSYLAADVQDNVFGGNLEQDFRTASFLSAGETFTSLDTTGDQTFDVIYHDDTAQFDLRFQNNSGNQILPESLGDDVNPLGATYTTLDPLKAITMGNLGAQRRNASLFQVENGANLDNPNNTFINFGITQPINGAFGTGGYNIRAAADPLFPNIGFAPFLP